MDVDHAFDYIPGLQVVIFDEEIKLAIKVGLIDPDQAWWWKEEWQKGEREAEKEIAQKEVSEPSKSVERIIEHLNKGQP